MEDNTISSSNTKKKTTKIDRMKNNKIHLSSIIATTASLIIISMLLDGVSCLVISNKQMVRKERTILLYASSDDNDGSFKRSLKSSLSWSRSASKRGSKRERIKNVLAKARRITSSGSTVDTNTGETRSKSDIATSISNNYDIAHLRQQKSANGRCNTNEHSTQDVSIPSVIAEAASIGGSGGDFYQTTKNGTREPKNGKAVKTSSPASTFSPPVVPYPKSNPEDELSLQTTTNDNNKVMNTQVETRVSEVDAFKGDVSAAFSLPPEPLPFTLPKLTPQQHQDLLNGERVQHQNDMGREGSGFVVVDVKAPPEAVWQCLLDFESYPTLIDTVREIKMYTSTHLKQDYYHERPVDDVHNACSKLKFGIPSVTRAAFTLSKFRLNIAAIHSYTPHPQGHHMIFTLDPACTNLVLRAAKGIWYTQSNPDNKGSEYTRVWLLCEVKVSNMLPMWITYYAARKAMPRATTWLKPTVEENHNNNIINRSNINSNDQQ